MLDLTPGKDIKEAILALNDLEKKLFENKESVCRVRLNVENGTLADDILLWVNHHSLDSRIIFVFESLSVNLPFTRELQNKRFHLSGFFGKLASRHTQVDELKRYYNAVADHLSIPESNDLSKIQWPLLAKRKWSFKALRSNTFKFLKPAKAAGQKLFNNHHSAENDAISKVYNAEIEDPRQWKRVLITGWYGTETSGDKAILGEIIHRLRIYNPIVRITVTTIDERVSRQTHFEMGLVGVDIVHIHKAAEPEIMDPIDAVVMGGGPLMESRQIVNIRNIFREANRKKKARVIFGCGVGPIHTPEMRAMISDICRMATSGFYRDEAGKAYAIQLGGIQEFPVACDPAIAYVARWKAENMPIETEVGNLQLKCLLREQTKEYFQHQGFTDKQCEFIRGVTSTLEGFHSLYPECNIDMMPMHMYWKGNDDRLFNRKIMDAMATQQGIHCVKEYLDINTLLTRLSAGNLAIAMRYHGHLFCLALGIPFLSIDYTGNKGKVYSLLERTGLLEYSEKYSDYRADSAIRKLQKLTDRREEIKISLLKDSAVLVKGLEEAYETLWGKEIKQIVEIRTSR